MIDKIFDQTPDLQDFSPIVSEWFEQRLSFATEAQKLVWPVARRGENLLLTSPTGSGKTLAAFLVSLDSLIRGTWDPVRRIMFFRIFG